MLVLPGSNHIYIYDCLELISLFGKYLSASVFIIFGLFWVRMHGARQTWLGTAPGVAARILGLITEGSL